MPPKELVATKGSQYHGCVSPTIFILPNEVKPGSEPARDAIE